MQNRIKIRATMLRLALQ